MIKQIMILLALLFGLFFLPGCMVTLEGTGEFGFKQSTTWSVYHTTKDSNEKQVSTSKLNSQPLEDWWAADVVGPPASE